jgi:hypothetical protein
MTTVQEFIEFLQDRYACDDHIAAYVVDSAEVIDQAKTHNKLIISLEDANHIVDEIHDADDDAEVGINFEVVSQAIDDYPYDRVGHVIDCDQCEPMMIQKVFTHETGCPNAGLEFDEETGLLYWPESDKDDNG